MKRVLQTSLAITLLFTLCACEGQPSGTGIESSSFQSAQIDETSYTPWEQPGQDEWKDFLKAKIEEFSTQILHPGDEFMTELQNSSYDQIETKELYQEWKSQCLAWAYGAQHFDVSSYDCDGNLAEILQTSGQLVAQFPDAFKESYYRTTDHAAEDFSALGNKVQTELSTLINIVYVKDVVPLTVGDVLEGNQYVSFTFQNSYYVDDILPTKSGRGTVYVVPNQQSILVLEFTVKNVFTQTLSYANTGVLNMDDYMKVSAIFGDTYEYDGELYVETVRGYDAVHDSFSDVSPLEERTVYAIIKVPTEAKTMPAVISTEYNGKIYQCSVPAEES